MVEARLNPSSVENRINLDEITMNTHHDVCGSPFTDFQMDI
jgi:hypothetical protein